MDLQEIFGEELTPKVKEIIGDKYEIREKSEDYITFKKSEGSYVKRDEYNRINTEKGNLEAQLNDLNSKVGNLDEFSSKNKELKEELEKIKADGELLKQNLTLQNERDRKRARLVLKINAKNNNNLDNTDLIMAKYFNNDETIDNIPEVNGEIVGFDEIMNPIIDKHKSLFGTQQLQGTPPANGDPTGGKGGISDLTDVDKQIAKMTTLSEETIADIKKSDKDKYEKLKKLYAR